MMGKKLNKSVWIILILLTFIFIAGCISLPQPTPKPPTENATVPVQDNTTTLANVTTACNDKECFISAANDCKDISITTTEDVGVIRYASSKNCIFTKTLVTLTDDETREMKKLLEGKSMTCEYKKGKFDSRLVTSLIYGTEYCLGDLKDNLGRLVVFS